MTEKGKYAVVGGANGIGRALVECLLASGNEVFVLDKDDVALGEMTQHKPGVKTFHADLMDGRSIDDFCEWVRETAGCIDGVANIAAEACFETFSTSSELWDRAMRGSVAAYSRIVARLIPALRMPGAAIVNMASISAHVAKEGYGTYAASKAAVVALTRCMALELGPRGIRANSVSPGTIWTANNAYHIGRAHGLDRQGADAAASIGGRHMLGRCGDPGEVANAIMFLLSSQASFITGTDLAVDGGYMAQ